MKRRAQFTVALTFVLATGCGQNAEVGKTPGPQEIAGYQLPADIQFTFHWTAQKGLDLTSPPAVVTRAFMESMDITMLSNMRGGYQGYDRVTRHLDDLHFATNFPQSPVSGTWYQHLLKLERDDRGWHAIVCTWENGLTYHDGPSFETNSGSGALEARASSIDLQPPPLDKPQRTNSGGGPARYPSNDVFENWSVPSADLAAPVEYRQQCQALVDNPVPAELRTTTPQTFDHPLPSLPPTPGWPEKSSNAG